MTITTSRDMPFSFSDQTPDYSMFALHSKENNMKYIHPMNVTEMSGIKIKKEPHQISRDGYRYNSYPRLMDIIKFKFRKYFFN